ncbi:WD40 repeat-like protein [Suillus weaverae]|nr:WD40 repeat-like protein [Suillus weaverae]
MARFASGAQRPANSKLNQSLVIHDISVSSVVCSPDGHLLIYATYDDQIYFYFWCAPPSSGSQLGCFFRAHSDSINSLAISPVAELIASASRDGTARLWNTMTRKPFGRVLQHTDEVSTVAFSPKEFIIATIHVVSPPSLIAPASHITSGLDKVAVKAIRAFESDDDVAIRQNMRSSVPQMKVFVIRPDGVIGVIVHGPILLMHVCEREDAPASNIA